MSSRSTEHATFVIERTYPASPAQVFAAWAEKDAKERWFGPGEEHELDFRAGGREHLKVRTGAGVLYTFDSLYREIVEDERIVYGYEMHMDGVLISVSVATIELDPAGDGTRLVLTEQGVFLDGHDTAAAREHGTRELLGALESALAGMAGAGAS
jgi:uncharacterized protein YndB with AHSA1/START domain